MPDPVIRGVSAHAKASPTRPAFIHGTRILRYGELNARASGLAKALVKYGASRTKPASVILPNGFASFEIATAAAMADVPFLPINWHLKSTELAYLLADAGVGAVVTDFQNREEVSHAMRQGGIRGEPLIAGSGDYEAAASKPAKGDSGPGPEIVFYTSGTTARPKGVVHGGLGQVAARSAGMEGQMLLWEWSESDVYVMSGPSYHAAHAGWGLSALYAGATTVLLDGFDARDFLDAISRHGGTRSFMVPAHFIRLLELTPKVLDTFDLSTFRLVVHGGAPCPIAVKRKMMETFKTTDFFELYGASEGGATRISPEEWRLHPGSVGKPWPGVEIRILDDLGNTLLPGKDGIIWIKPPSAQHFTYRNDPEATQRAWRDDAFSVGDIGHLDDEGYLTITDRVSDMVLWGGVNIAPREIEEVLHEHPKVIDCAVFGVPDERDGEHLKAMVELRAPATVYELAAFVQQSLADYKVPKDWEIVEQLPRDPNGKILKRLLRAQAKEK